MDRSVSPRPLPIALTRLDTALCVVVGGGGIATRKVKSLLQSGANVRVISPALHPELAAWRDAGQFQHVARRYAEGDLADAFLVIAATDRREVNAAVADEAYRRGVLVNIVDDPHRSSFWTMATVTRGDVVLAVSTGGDSPALAAHIRRKLETTFGPEYGVLAERLGRLRRALADTVPPAARAELWRALATDEVLGWIAAGQAEKVEAYVEALLAGLETTDDGR